MSYNVKDYNPPTDNDSVTPLVTGNFQWMKTTPMLKKRVHAGSVQVLEAGKNLFSYYWWSNSMVIDDLIHPYLGHQSISKKDMQLNWCRFQYLWEKQNYPVNILFISFGTCKKIEVKRGYVVKKWEFVQRKKKYYINFSKLDYLHLWPMVDFRREVVQIRDFSSEIQGFEAFRGVRQKVSNPWILDDKSQIWATFRRKLTIAY